MTMPKALCAITLVTSLAVTEIAVAAEASFACRTGRLCTLECKDGVNGKTIVSDSDVEKATVITEDNVVIFVLERATGEEPRILTVSNRAACALGETGNEQ